jgi:hypothetical protein
MRSGEERREFGAHRPGPCLVHRRKLVFRFTEPAVPMAKQARAQVHGADCERFNGACKSGLLNSIPVNRTDLIQTASNWRVHA